MRIAGFLLAGMLLCGFDLPAHSDNAPELPPSPEQFTKGAGLFASICAHCHGPHMVNPGNVTFDLRKFPHDDRTRFFNAVRNGKNAMPPWKDVLHPDEIDAVWDYVRTGGAPP